ncbi:MAG: PSD1 and planctomycete cytochrome C domain-containing protein [Chthoniobacteraceae bacterium]
MKPLLILSFTLLTLPWTAAASPLAAQVRALLNDKCLACHGDDAEKIKGDYDMRTREGTLKGGESGEAAVVPGQPEKSPLFLAVTRRDKDFAMPPKENEKLSPEQVELLRKWIAGGAEWTDAVAKPKWDAADGVTVATSGGQSGDWNDRRYKPEEVWAYQPIRRPAVPAAESKHPIDAFILEKLAEKLIAGFALPADKLTLLRRATFDLTGLPPTTGEIDAFLKDTSPDAFAAVLTRLLESPRYGEQQARHWLDVVRYADTSGFSNDYERPNAWRYRDYVIRSFNSDKRFDRFILEQIAGDELEPNNPEMAIAVGFLRSGPWEHTAMTVAAITRQQFLDDVTHAVGVTFLGQGLRCCQCHDHKFDPLPTRDYYAIQAVFAPTQFAERDVPFLPVENTRGIDDGRAPVQARLALIHERSAALKKKSEDGMAAWLAGRGVKSIDELPEKERPRKDYLGATSGLTKTDLSLRKIYEKSRAYLERELKRFEPLAFSVYSGVDNKYTSTKPVNPMPAQTLGAVAAVHILANGSLESPAEEVKPGVISAMAGARDTVLPDATEGRRLALARWIASPENTLTARVIVNRIWQQHFGHGLVATPNNLGKMGARPTHPELLDWLATRFVERGWSIKELHRLIMTSQTYQQASTRDDVEKIRALDSKNSLLAYFPARRLAAEEIRDAMLALTGELNPEMGGPGVFPEINWEVAAQPRHIMGSVAPAYLPSRTPQERHRRTIYAFRYRTLSDPMLEVFNRPGSEISCEVRDQTTVTPQVFALFNSEFTHNRALALAAAIGKSEATTDARIAKVFRTVHGRAPSAGEAKACAAHFEKLLAHHRAHPPQPVALPMKVKRQMVEELTGETVEWEEDLPGMDRYQRDLMPWEVAPETRAFAEVCLALLNSNEFLYLR